MVKTPYAISGKVFKSDGSTPVSGATVTVYDRQAGDSTSDTTDSNGSYVLDLANMTESFSQGDNLNVEAVKGNKIKRYATTVSGDDEEHNFTLEYDDALGVVIELLEDNWRKENTDNILPTVDKIFNQKEIDLSNKDYLLLYEINEADRPFSLGGKTFEEITSLSIDIRTSNKISSIANARPHVMKLREEVKRILKSKIAAPALPFQLIVPRMVRDLSNKMTGLGRVVMDFDISYWGT